MDKQTFLLTCRRCGHPQPHEKCWCNHCRADTKASKALYQILEPAVNGDDLNDLIDDEGQPLAPEVVELLYNQT